MRRAALGLLFVVMAAALWACDGAPVLSTAPMATSAPTAARTTLQPLPTPTPAIATPSPVPAPTPTPTTTLEPWTPGPAGDVPPLATPKAGDKLSFHDYIIVEANGLQGVVDRYGREVLPISFSHVAMVNYDFGGEYWPGQYAFPPRGRVLFFAIPTRYIGEKFDPKRRTGGIYDARGRRINNKEYNEVCFIGEHVLRVWVDKGAEPGGGAISDTGKALVPLRYDSVEMIGDRIVASSSLDDSTDLYTAAGKMIKTVKGALPFSDRVSVGQGMYLKGVDFSHHSGDEEVLIDRDLRVLLTGEGYSIDWLCADRFTVRRGGKAGVVDSQNYVVVPLSYETIELAHKGNKSCFCASGPDGCALYDIDGKAIYHSDEYTRLRMVDGRMIVGNDWGGRVLNLDGRDLLGRGDVTDWLPEARLYQCEERGTHAVTLLHEDGMELPLPRVPGIGVLSADRFLVWLHDDEVSVLDSAGNTIIPGVRHLERAYDMDDALFYWLGEGAQQRVWLVDYDGNRLWPEPVDRAEPAWGTSLFSVHAGSHYGLMEAHGRWIWSASDYDALDD